MTCASTTRFLSTHALIDGNTSQSTRATSSARSELTHHYICASVLHIGENPPPT